MKRTGFLWVAVVAALTVGCSNTDRATATGKAADSGSAVGTSGTADVKSADKDFVHDVAIANMAEIELGRSASEKSTNAEVKTFALMMADDHTAASDQLKRAVSTYPIEWPVALDDTHRDLSEKLAKLQGLEFDKEYAKAMVDGHQNFVEKLEPRLDHKTLADWKARLNVGTEGKTLPEQKADARDVQILPEKSDNAITTAINQWAADVYPVAQKHLEAARTLEKNLKKRTTN